MNTRIRLTWISWLIFDVAMFRKLRGAAPLALGGIIFVASAMPLLLGGQHDYVFSRPLLCGLVGCTYVLYCGYFFSYLYRQVFQSLTCAFPPSQARKRNEIGRQAIFRINDDRLSLAIYAVLLILTFGWFSLAFYGALPRSLFPFLYVLDEDWYRTDPGKIYRLSACLIMIAASLALLWTAVWFQFWHWRMFQRLLELRFVSSPILIYHGFSKLWLATNLSSVALLSGNLVVLWFLDFRPQPIQILGALLITLPGTMGLLHPTCRLYWLLWNKKETRIREVLKAAESKYRVLSGPDRTLAFSSAYSNIGAEKNIGNLQAVTSLLIGAFSFVVAIMQIVGLDYHTKIFGSP